jgi:hypothetical protein
MLVVTVDPAALVRDVDRHVGVIGRARGMADDHVMLRVLQRKSGSSCVPGEADAGD